jgi:hypothetical protein
MCILKRSADSLWADKIERNNFILFILFFVIKMSRFCNFEIGSRFLRVQLFPPPKKNLILDICFGG